jgi:hypothetical protein
MKIFFDSSRGKRIGIEVEEDDTIEFVRMKISKAEGLFCFTITLI